LNRLATSGEWHYDDGVGGNDESVSRSEVAIPSIKKEEKMRISVLMVIWLCVCAGNALAQDPPADKPVQTPAEKVDPKDAATISSYGIGMNMGRSMKADGVDLDLEAFIQGLRDSIKGTPPKYTTPQIRAAMEIFQREMQAKQEESQKTAGDKNRREGQAFLTKNKTKNGVKTTASGLQYEVIKSGKGASPKATDTVKVHYEGKLLDGTVFDSSIKRNEPAEFPVNRVIRGWTEALQLMKVGDKWRLYIPSEMAYGAQGMGGDIGPNAVLTFEVELLGIEAAPAGDLGPGTLREK
jgi:FKBP-type peptidyl-prolyl cis-trans isomerase FklB